MDTDDHLEQAASLIRGDRARKHGDATELHRQVAELWTAYLRLSNTLISIGPQQVLVMMALLKIARTCNGEFNRDDYVDLLGYAALAAEIAEIEQRNLERREQMMREERGLA